MQLLVLILNKTECLTRILDDFLDYGISGATIYDSTGMLQYIGHSTVEPPPIFGSLRRYLNPDCENNKTVIALVREEQVDGAVKIINSATGGISQPNVAIVFTVPVLRAEGL